MSNGRIVPFDCLSWNKVDDAPKKCAIKQIFVRFEFDDKERATPWLVAKCNEVWRHAKNTLKVRYFDPTHEDLDKHLKKCPNYIAPPQWEWLVKYWMSTEGKAKSKQCHDARMEARLLHRCGSTSFAAYKEEMRIKKGKEPEELEFFMASHTPMGSNTLDPVAEEVLEKAKEMLIQVPEGSIDEKAKNEALIEALGGCTHGGIPMARLVSLGAIARQQRDSIAASALSVAKQASRENNELRARLDRMDEEHRNEIQRMDEARRHDMMRFSKYIEHLVRQQQVPHGVGVSSVAGLDPIETSVARTSHGYQTKDPYFEYANHTQDGDDSLEHDEYSSSPQQ